MQKRDLIIEKRKARHRWFRKRFPADKTRLNLVATQLRRNLLTADLNFFKASASELSSTRTCKKSLWRTLKLINHPKQRDAPVKNHLGRWTTNAAEKATVPTSSTSSNCFSAKCSCWRAVLPFSRFSTWRMQPVGLSYTRSQRNGQTQSLLGSRIP